MGPVGVAVITRGLGWAIVGVDVESSGVGIGSGVLVGVGGFSEGAMAWDGR